MSQGLTYALVTPARNEAVNLRRLAASVMAQTVVPVAWIIVDDGSTDETKEIAEELMRARSWVRVVDSPGQMARRGPIGDGRSSGRDILAFNTGVAALEEPVDIVVKLDADVSFAHDFCERLAAEFAADPGLGIASGTCYELENGRWSAQLTGEHVRGATRAWRWSCFDQVRPLEERLGWDIVDELKAHALGWRTRSVAHLAFLHHRPPGHRDGRLRAWADQGETAYFVGYRFWYLLARALYRARRDPAAFALIWGYAIALALRRPRHRHSGVREQLRRRQNVRNLALRVRGANGRGA
jgi:biofilm PGA synthesis N-glycosyltransferase PgaC